VLSDIESNFDLCDRRKSCIKVAYKMHRDQLTRSTCLESLPGNRLHFPKFPLLCSALAEDCWELYNQHNSFQTSSIRCICIYIYIVTCRVKAGILELALFHKQRTRRTVTTQRTSAKTGGKLWRYNAFDWRLFRCNGTLGQSVHYRVLQETT
jgi:hypothetical protein